MAPGSRRRGLRARRGRRRRCARRSNRDSTTGSQSPVIPLTRNAPANSAAAPATSEERQPGVPDDSARAGHAHQMQERDAAEEDVA